MIDEMKRLVKRHGVSGVLHAFAQALGELEREVAGTQPKSTSLEVAASFRYAKRAVEATAKRIRYQANRAGF